MPYKITPLSFKLDSESMTLIIDQLLKMKVKMTKWEYDFAYNMKLRHEAEARLSDKQLTVLSKLWEKY